MKQLKFRIWDGNNRYFVYPDVLELNSGLDYQQFTGLFDKQGKEIYEGDIVAIRREDDGSWEAGECERAIIEYYDSNAAFILQIYTVFGGEGYELLGGDEAGKYYRERIEVIGNIYEEELKEAKNDSSKMPSMRGDRKDIP